MKRRTDRELVRQALHYAIEEREGWLASVGEPPHPIDAPHVERGRQLVAQWRALLRRRYGEVPAYDNMDTGTPVPLATLMAGPDTAFAHPPLTTKPR